MIFIQKAVYCIAPKYESSIILLTPHSPKLNPTEKILAVLKRKFNKCHKSSDSFVDGLHICFSKFDYNFTLKKSFKKHMIFGIFIN